MSLYGQTEFPGTKEELNLQGRECVSSYFVPNVRKDGAERCLNIQREKQQCLPYEIELEETV